MTCPTSPGNTWGTLDASHFPLTTSTPYSPLRLNTRSTTRGLKGPCARRSRDTTTSLPPTVARHLAVALLAEPEPPLARTAPDNNPTAKPTSRASHPTPARGPGSSDAHVPGVCALVCSHGSVAAAQESEHGSDFCVSSTAASPASATARVLKAKMAMVIKDQRHEPER